MRHSNGRAFQQLLRSGTSVGANYREAFRGLSKAEWSEWGENIDGQPRGSGERVGNERTNSSRNATTACVRLKNGACREAAT